MTVPVERTPGILLENCLAMGFKPSKQDERPRMKPSEIPEYMTQPSCNNKQVFIKHSQTYLPF